MGFIALRSIGISIAIFFGIALGLIVSQRPGTIVADGGLDFEGLMAQDAGVALPMVRDKARDGAEMISGHLAGPEGAPLLVLVHGSGWHGAQFDRLAHRLAATAEVLVVNLRGHYNGAGARGDVSYVGQLEDDLADLIKARAKLGQKVVLGGHSSGGGLVVRFAGGAHRELIDGAVLLAPFLKYNAPTTLKDAGGWAHPLMRRIIGLSMLNMARVRALDHLVAIEFAMPDAVRNGPTGAQATLAYSWRLNLSYAPRNAYLVDVAALPKFQLIVGAQDESFVAQDYKPLMSGVTDAGQYHVIEGVGHLGVVDAPQTAALMEQFLADY